MLDGASLDVITPAVADGRLPNFGRIFDRARCSHLATLRPTQAEPVWSAVATGRTPMQNGVRSSASYRALGGTPASAAARLLLHAGARAVRFPVRRSRTPPTDLLARPIWSILSDQGVSVGVIGWPLTQPAAAGPWLSRQRSRFTACPKRSSISTARRASGRPRLLEAAKASLQVPPDPDPVSVLSVVGTPPSGDYDVAPRSGAGDADRVHAQLLDALAALAPRFMAVRFPGIDAVGHHFLRYANPSPFGDVSDDERRRYGRRARAVLRVSRHACRTADQRPRAGRRAAGGVGIRHGAAQPEQARARAHGREPANQRQPRARARRVRARLRRGRPAGPASARVGPRPHADHPLFLRPAGWPRHGRLRAHRAVPPVVHGRATGELYTRATVADRASSCVRSARCGAWCRVRSAGCGPECGVRGAGCGVRSAGCGVRSAGCPVQGAARGLLVHGAWV